jgi:hypothetical protein
MTKEMKVKRGAARAKRRENIYAFRNWRSYQRAVARKLIVPHSK